MSRVTDFTTSAGDAAPLAALCAQQEAAFRFKEFSDEIAWEVGTTVRETIREKYGAKAGVVIHIETFTGHTLFSAAVGKPPVVGPDNW